MDSDNEKRRSNVTSSLIGWAHTQNDLCWLQFDSLIIFSFSHIELMTSDKEVHRLSFYTGVESTGSATGYAKREGYLLLSNSATRAVTSIFTAALILVTVLSLTLMRQWTRTLVESCLHIPRVPKNWRHTNVEPSEITPQLSHRVVMMPTFVATGGTGGRRYENLRCLHWRWHNDVGIQDVT